MATQDDVRRIALALPDTAEDDDRFAFSVRKGAKAKGFCWVWLERPGPKQPRVPNPDVLGVRVADETAKHELIAADPETFFTEPHYDGYPAVLVRLEHIDPDELAELITDAWRLQASKSLVRRYDGAPAGGGGGSGSS